MTDIKPHEYGPPNEMMQDVLVTQVDLWARPGKAVGSVRAYVQRPIEWEVDPSLALGLRPPEG